MLPLNWRKKNHYHPGHDHRYAALIDGSFSTGSAVEFRPILSDNHRASSQSKLQLPASDARYDQRAAPYPLSTTKPSKENASGIADRSTRSSISQQSAISDPLRFVPERGFERSDVSGKFTETKTVWFQLVQMVVY